MDQKDYQKKLEQSLIDIVVESWRFTKIFSRTMTKLKAGQETLYVYQILYYLNRMEESLDAVGMHIVNVEGHPYDPGMAAAALNIGEFGHNDGLVVAQMVEPIIMGKTGLIRAGTVILKRPDVSDVGDSNVETQIKRPPLVFLRENPIHPGIILEDRKSGRGSEVAKEMDMVVSGL